MEFTFNNASCRCVNAKKASGKTLEKRTTKKEMKRRRQQRRAEGTGNYKGVHKS
jgi:hypothetical protein